MMSNHSHTQDLTIQFTIDRCFLGTFLAAQSRQGLCALFLGEKTKELKADLQKRFSSCKLIENRIDLLPQVKQFLENPKNSLRFVLNEHGTPFQLSVWKALRDIPFGTTASYTDIANAIGKPKAVRAVAQACAQNPLAVITPCHRVLRKDGSLSGYRWGTEFKKFLLNLEGSQKK